MRPKAEDGEEGAKIRGECRPARQSESVPSGPSAHLRPFCVAAHLRRREGDEDVGGLQREQPAGGRPHAEVRDAVEVVVDRQLGVPAVSARLERGGRGEQARVLSRPVFVREGAKVCLRGGG